MGDTTDLLELRGRTFSGLDGLPPAEARRLRDGVVRYGTACGCKTGAMGAALAGCLYLSGISPAVAIAAAVVGGATGKGLGLWWARRRFDDACRRLESALSARTRG